MIRFLFSILTMLILAGNVNADILVMSPNGSFTSDTTLEKARTSANCVGKTVVVTSALTATQSNILSAWPNDRALKVEKGGSIANSKAFDLTGAEFSAGLYTVFAGAGDVLGLNKAEIVWFGDGAGAWQKAIKSSLNVHVPDGAYVVNTALVGRTGLVIMGDAPIEAEEQRAAHIKLSGNNFIEAGHSRRIKLTIKNLLIEGDGSGVGINGQFGGLVEGCKFKNLSKGINNPAGYLTDYINNQFESCFIALNLNVTNSVNILRNWFGGKSQKAIVTGSDAQGCLIQGNNFNVGASTQTIIESGGLVKIDTNYFEAFVAPLPNAAMIVHTTTGFDNKGPIIEGNIINGQKKMNYGIVINGFDANNRWVPGRITNNWIGGFVQDSVYFGLNNFNNVSGIEIKDNYPKDIIPGNRHAERADKPIAYTTFTTETSIASNTYIRIPIGEVISVDNASGFSSTSNVYRTRKTGYYRVTANIVAKVASASTKTIEISIRKNGVSIFSVLQGITYNLGSTYSTVTPSAIIECALGDNLDVAGRTGDSVFKGSFSIEYLMPSEYPRADISHFHKK